jgi:hypothetical protein
MTDAGAPTGPLLRRPLEAPAGPVRGDFDVTSAPKE